MLKTRYSRGYPFSEGLSSVYDVESKKRGSINRKGDVVIPFIYDSALPFKEGVARVYNKNEDFLYIDKKGDVLIRLKRSEGFDDASSFKNGIVYVEKNGKFGYINKRKEEIIPIICDKILPFGEFNSTNDMINKTFNKDMEKITCTNNNKESIYSLITGKCLKNCE